MNIALLVVRFIARLRRNIARTVLRPLLGKRKLRSVYDREIQVYRTDSQSFLRNIGTFGLYRNSFRENSDWRMNRATFGLQIPPPDTPV